MAALGRGIAFVVFAALLVVVVYLLASFVLMLLVNVVLNQYGAEPLQYGSALAITLLLGIFGGVLRNGNNDK